MKEELYVNTNGQWYQLDLETPSGITLEFSNNLFNDISKFTANKTFSFGLPKTVNNSKALALVDDLRFINETSMVKFQAHYVCNGILNIDTANLYVLNVTDEKYEVCLTWGITNNFEKLSKENLKLKDVLPNTIIDYTNIQTKDLGEGVFDNSVQFYHAWYFAGVVDNFNYRKRTGDGDIRLVSSFFPTPPPVIPVHYLLDKLSQRFGVRFNLTEDGTLSKEEDVPVVDINYLRKYLVLPLVTLKAPEQIWRTNKTDFNKVSTILKEWKPYASAKTEGVIGFTTNIHFNNDFLVSYDKTPNKVVYSNITYYFYDCFLLKNNISYVAEGRMNIKFHLNENTYIDPTLEIVRPYLDFTGDNLEEKFEVIASLQGTLFETSNMVDPEFGFSYKRYSFVFDPKYGTSGITFDIATETKTDTRTFPAIFFRVTAKYKSGDDFKVENTNTFVDLCEFSIRPTDYKNAPENVDFTNSLPDLTCMDFIKSIYQILGGFPMRNTDGSIGISYYGDFSAKKNEAYDWSDKLLFKDKAEKVEIGSTEWKARNNYYLSKSDKLEIITKKEIPDENADVYQDGYFNITIDGAELEDDATMITLPYSTEFLKHGSNELPTGNTTKAWSYSNVKPASRDFIWLDETLGDMPPLEYEPKLETAQPTIGYVMRKVGVDNKPYLTYKVLNGFGDEIIKHNYKVLDFMSNPIKLTINIRLTDIDLRDLDMSRPVYLDKFNSYFAINKIRRGDDGICQCELYKINI